MTKPIKPDIAIPEGFAQNGQKTDFTSDKISDGFDSIDPDVLAGDNLNKFIDDTYKGLNYTIDGVKDLYVQGIPEYDCNETYNAKSVVKTFDEEGNILLYKSLSDNNNGNTLSNADYWIKVNLGSSGTARNIGEIVTSLIPLTDANLHLLDGSLLNGDGVYSDFVKYISSLAEDYPNLFTDEETYSSYVLNYGVCGKFVYDEDDNALRLPKITGFIEGTLDAAALGDLVEAGVPNITAILYQDGINADTNNGVIWGASGAVYLSSDTSSVATYNGTTRRDVKHVNFDASRSSSVYGKSSTVQPQSIKGYIYIVVAAGIESEIKINVDEIVTDLDRKSNTDLSNITEEGKVTISGAGMPSNKYIDLTLGESESTYTAPANGWFYVYKKIVSSSNQYFVLENQTRNYQTNQANTGENSIMYIFPVCKGDVVRAGYSASGTTNYFRFIYAQGLESEA